MLISGVYAIRNKLNSKCYFGSTVDWMTRRKRHRYWLRKGAHHCQYLQRAWNKYGEDAFEFVFILDIEPTGLIDAEQTLFDTNPERYNLGTSAALPWLGKKHRPESRQKMSENMRGIPCSEGAKKKLREANLGKKYDVSTKAKVAASSRRMWEVKGRDEMARSIRKRGYSWCESAKAWMVRIWHCKRELFRCLCDTEDEARQIVALARQQCDSGQPISVPLPERQKAATAAHIGRGYHWCNSKQRFIVKKKGERQLGSFRTEAEAIAAVEALRNGF